MTLCNSTNRSTPVIIHHNIYTMYANCTTLSTLEQICYDLDN